MAEGQEEKDMDRILGTVTLMEWVERKNPWGMLKVIRKVGSSQEKEMPQGLRKGGIPRMEFTHGPNLTHVDRGNDRKVIIWFVL